MSILKLVAGFLIGLGTVLAVMPKFIDYLKGLSLRQTISEYALEEDKKKAGTPIMGGVLFIAFPILTTIALCVDAITDIEIWVVLLAFAGYGMIGFIDDYLIAVRKKNDGLLPKYKFGMQVVLAVVFFLLYRSHAETTINVFGKTVELGMMYCALVLFMFAGSSNAVNLTDGMDGLSAGCTVLALTAYTIIGYVQQRAGVTIFCVSLIGSLFGYLYYNKQPARVFMGDTGALALGGVLAALAMVTKTELSLILIGGIFVIETVCVIIQQVSVRAFHKRVFIYTPIHYAFRLKGMKDLHTIHLFYAVEAVLAAIGLFTALH